MTQYFYLLKHIYINNVKQSWYDIFPNTVVKIIICCNNCLILKAKIYKVQAFDAFLNVIHVFQC